MLERVFKDLKKFEGLSLKTYRCTSGKLTIGYGRNLDDNGISEKEAEMLLIFDVARLIPQLDRQVNFWKGQPANVRILLLQMSYQLGVGGLLKFKKFLLALQENDFEQAKKEMFDSRWAKQTPARVRELSKYLDMETEEKDIQDWKNNLKLLQGYVNSVQNMSIIE
ncbi:MAG: hypothetical protein FWG98_07915 [Candidatus Cloacimonetes bacterium]|nr:hypothetical protein [Candidatus Cloacimonadota bacterium]